MRIIQNKETMFVNPTSQEVQELLGSKWTLIRGFLYEINNEVHLCLTPSLTCSTPDVLKKIYEVKQLFCYLEFTVFIENKQLYVSYPLRNSWCNPILGELKRTIGQLKAFLKKANDVFERKKK